MEIIRQPNLENSSQTLVIDKTALVRETGIKITAKFFWRVTEDIASVLQKEQVAHPLIFLTPGIKIADKLQASMIVELSMMHLALHLIMW